MDIEIPFGKNSYVRLLADLIEFRIWGKFKQVEWKDVNLIIGGENGKSKRFFKKKYLLYINTNLKNSENKKKLYFCIGETNDKYKFLYSLEKTISILKTVRGNHGCAQWWAIPPVSNKSIIDSEKEIDKNLYQSFKWCKYFIKYNTRLNDFYYENNDQISIAADFINSLDKNDPKYLQRIEAARNEIGLLEKNYGLGYVLVDALFDQMLDLAVKAYKNGTDLKFTDS